MCRWRGSPPARPGGRAGPSGVAAGRARPSGFVAALRGGDSGYHDPLNRSSPQPAAAQRARTPVGGALRRLPTRTATPPLPRRRSSRNLYNSPLAGVWAAARATHLLIIFEPRGQIVFVCPQEDHHALAIGNDHVELLYR